MIPQHGTVEEIRPARGQPLLSVTGRTNASSIDSSRTLKKPTFFSHKIVGAESGSRILIIKGRVTIFHLLRKP